MRAVCGSWGSWSGDNETQTIEDTGVLLMNGKGEELWDSARCSTVEK